MIRIARVALPNGLSTKLGELTSKIEEAHTEHRIQVAKERWQNTTIRTNVRKPLLEVLATMAPGRQYCMYCGDNQGTDFDHFEPVVRNPLRTFDWLNHLLACSVCNSHNKRDQFPVDDQGQPLLIDPTVEDPFDHLRLTISVGEYAALTPKGDATIEVCGLNRQRLVQGREDARYVVEALLKAWARAHRTEDSTRMATVVAQIQRQPFADVCQAMLRYADYPGAEVVFAATPHALPLLRMPELRAALLN